MINSKAFEYAIALLALALCWSWWRTGTPWRHFAELASRDWGSSATWLSAATWLPSLAIAATALWLTLWIGRAVKKCLNKSTQGSVN